MAAPRARPPGSSEGRSVPIPMREADLTHPLPTPFGNMVLSRIVGVEVARRRPGRATELWATAHVIPRVPDAFLFAAASFGGTTAA